MMTTTTDDQCKTRRRNEATIDRSNGRRFDGAVGRGGWATHTAREGCGGHTWQGGQTSLLGIQIAVLMCPEAVRSERREGASCTCLLLCAFVLFAPWGWIIGSFFFVPEPSQPITWLSICPFNRRIGPMRSIDRFDAMPCNFWMGSARCKAVARCSPTTRIEI